MSNLTTRKIVLGLLMVLVLAFSVQGIADALTLRISSGDLTTVAPNQTFTLRFSVLGQRSPQAQFSNTSRGNATDIEYADNTRTRAGDPDTITGNFTVIVDSGYSAIDGDTHYYTVTTTDDNVPRTSPGTGTVVRTTQTRNWLTESEAYYYNDESVTITSTPNVPLMRGDTAVTSLIERAEESDDRLSSGSSTSVTLTGSDNDAAAYDITITDNTDAADIDGAVPSPRASITFTVFVAGRNPAADVPEWGFIGLNSTTERYKVGGDDFGDDAITNASPGTHVRVEYSVIEGSGRLYVQRTPTRKTSASRTITTSSAAEVRLDMGGSTNKVRASISGVAPVTATFIFGHPEVAIVSGNGQEGGFGGQLDNPLVVKVTDERGRALSGLAAGFATTATGNPRFIPVPGTTVYTIAAAGRTLVTTFPTDADNIFTRVATSTRPPPAGAIFVQTDSRGEASTYFQLGTTETDTSQIVNVTAGGSMLIVPRNFRFDVESGERRPTLSILSGSNQTTDSNGDIEDPLVVAVRKDGNLLPGEQVTFRASNGTLIGYTDDSTDDPDDTLVSRTNVRVWAITDGRGQAEVTYFQEPGDGSDTVTATISGTDPDYEREVVFGINGGQGTRAPSQPSQPSQPATGTRTITITLSETTGEPGDEIDVTISASPNTVVVIDSGDLDGDDFSREFGTTPFDTVISLPDEEDEYTFTAEATGYTSDSATITVETGILGKISISQIGTPSNGAQSFSITVVDTDSARISGSLTVRVSGSGFTTRNVDTLNGIGNARLTLPTAASLYTLTASAEGYTSGTTQVRIAGTGQQEVADEEEEEVEEEVTVAAEPDSVGIVGPSQRDGTANTVLDAALIVEVVDEDGDAVADARVIFRVRTGQGRFSERGNGRAIAVQTNSSGHARATYTPISASSTVEAEARGVTRRVTFTITASGGSAGPVSRDVDGTPSGDISPVVHVVAASRPPMLWVDGGAIYALVDADVKEFAPSVDNALNIAVGGGKVYWTEKTSESSGTINSANLDGSDVTELVSVRSVPMGIAVDTAGSKLYWTASSGKIKRANLNGSGSENVVPGGLDTPMDLALADGNVYWTQGNGSVRFASLTGQIRSRPISTGSDTPGSLAIGGGKVYWTEKTATSAGTINSANLNGTDVMELTSIRSVPMGIAVDTARSKLYWTASSGKVKQANLNGSGAKNVVSGLGSPSDMVLSNSITAPAAGGTSAGSGTTASDSKYDVNGDGVVDGKDKVLVLDAVVTGTYVAKYDVNDDKKVNILDYVLVEVNIDGGAAGAPALLGMKLSAIQIDRLQEQIDLLIATNDRSPAAMRTLVYLQQLLVTARPEKTQLLANYPNPFNPETWIPYELATDTDVRITIYNTQGVVIRSLQFGHQSAGYYTGRDRAAYWDGRNALGEQVASGLYFYQLETDEMSLMRKMVILK